MFEVNVFLWNFKDAFLELISWKGGDVPCAGYAIVWGGVCLHHCGHVEIKYG